MRKYQARAAASHMAKLRIPRTVIKKILNHADRDITAIYDRYGYDDEKREALDMWAQRLREIVEKKRDCSVAASCSVNKIRFNRGGARNHIRHIGWIK